MDRLMLGTQQEEILTMVGQSGGNVHWFGHLVCWLIYPNVEFRSDEAIAILSLNLRNDL